MNVYLPNVTFPWKVEYQKSTVRAESKTQPYKVRRKLRAVARAYGVYPVLLAHDARVFLAYNNAR